MRRILIYSVAIVFAVALLARMSAYTVRFTEAAILTTFGKADPKTSVKRDPGLYLKWPQPVQSVTKYDTRARFVESRLEQQQTADDRLVIVEPYCTWRVDDPLVFFQRFSGAGERASDHYRRAEDHLKDYLRSAVGEVSRYRMTEMFTTGQMPSKIPELEERIRAAISSSELVGSKAIAILDVGISRIILPESTTGEVHNSMRAERAVHIKRLESQGDAEAQKIISSANANASKITEFAKAYAEEIRRLGDTEATQYVRQMNENPELAIFLKEIEFIREFVAKRATLFFDTAMPGFQSFSPRALDETRVGKIPGAHQALGDLARRNGASRTPAPQGEGNPGGNK